MEIDLVEQLGNEVAGLGTEHGDRVPVDTVRAVYDQLVAGMGRPRFQGVQKRRQVQALPGSRARRRWGSGGLAVFMSEVIGVGMWREWHRQRIGVDAGRYVLVVER